MPLNLGKGCSRMVPIGAQRKRKTKKKEDFLEEEEEDRGLVERRASPSAGRAHIAEYVHESWSICELELCDERYSRRLSSVPFCESCTPCWSAEVNSSNLRFPQMLAQVNSLGKSLRPKGEVNQRAPCAFCDRHPGYLSQISHTGE